MKYSNNNHKVVHKLSRSGSVYGSCVAYPTHEACSKLGEVSCNVTTEEECNNLKMNLDKIHSGFEVYFDRNRTCGNTKRTRPEILSGPKDVITQPLYPLYARFNTDVRFMSRGGPCFDNDGNERYDENGQSVCFVNNEPLPNFERIEYSCEKGITTKGDRNSLKFFRDTSFTENESDYCLGCERNNNLYAESDKPYHFVLNGNKPMAYKAIGRRGYLSQTTLYPIGDKKSSGMICTNEGCKYISDIKRYISKNGRIENVIYVYTPDVFNKLRYGSVKFNSIADAKKHFIEMYEVGGHGYDRPLSIDEMYEAHKDADALLSKNDLIQMLITYEIEKSVGLVDDVAKSYCACTVLSDLEVSSVNIDFPFSYSPIQGQDTLRVNVVRGTENYVVHNLNGKITANVTYSSSSRYSDKRKPLDVTFQKTNPRHEIVIDEVIGTCFLEDTGAIIHTTDRQCVRLGGTIATNLNEFYSENQKVRLNNKTYAYETRKTPDNYSQTFDIDYNPNVYSNQLDSDPDKNYDACANSNSTLETCLSCVEKNHVNMCEESKGKHACWNKFVGNAQTRGNEKTPEYKSPYCGDVRFFCKDLAPYSVCSRGISGDAREYRYATENTNVNDINAQQLPPQFYEPGLPDGKYNYINACCPEACSDCLFKAIRAAESGDVNDPLAPGIYDAGRNYPDVSNYYFRGCNAVNKCDGEDCCNGNTPVPNQDKKKCWSCGPFQIKRKYFDEAAKKYKNQHPACRVLRTYDYEKELCKDCKGSVQEIIKCCKRKHDISQLVIRCYLRRYTRNGSCQSGNCSCKTINSDGNQFTCQDIVRMHNGGGGRTRTIPCAQNRNATKPYWDKIKKALCNLGDECRRCISFDYSDCNEIKSLRYNCLFDDDPSRRSPSNSGKVKGKKILQDTNTVPSDVLLKGNVGPFSYQGTDTKTKVFGYYYPLYLTPDAARKANKDALNKNYFHTHSFVELPNYTFYMPNNSNNHGVATNGGFTEFVDIRERIPTFFSKNTPDSLYIPMTDDSATIEPIRLRTKFKDGSEST